MRSYFLSKSFNELSFELIEETCLSWHLEMGEEPWVDFLDLKSIRD
jgi:hypothetical protein